MLAIFCALRFWRKTDHFLSDIQIRWAAWSEITLLSGRARTRQVSGVRFAIGDLCVITRDSLLSDFNLIDDASLLVAGRHARRKAASWIRKLNRVFPGRRVVERELGPVAIDGHGSGVAIDRDRDLLARVARVGKGNPGLQFVAAAGGLAACLEGKQVFTWNAAAPVAYVEFRA